MMKNKILILTQCFVFCVFALSCSSDDNNAIVEIELGDNYLVAKIDGEDFIATSDKVSFQSSMISNAFYYTVEAEVDGKILTLRMGSNSFPPQMLTVNSGPYGSQNSLSIEDDEWVGTAQIQTEVVTDTSMSGTFSFTVENSNDNSIKTVTEGRFLHTY